MKLHFRITIVADDLRSVLIFVEVRDRQLQYGPALPTHVSRVQRAVVHCHQVAREFGRLRQGHCVE